MDIVQSSDQKKKRSLKVQSSDPKKKKGPVPKHEPLDVEGNITTLIKMMKTLTKKKPNEDK